jgi:hypothetical protein
MRIPASKENRMTSRLHGAVFSAFVFLVASLALAGDDQSAKPQDAQSNEATVPARRYSDPQPLFRVIQNGTWGYIDKSGKLVIPAQFEDAYPFSEGFAQVQTSHDTTIGMTGVYMQHEHRQFCFIDKTGRQIGLFYPAVSPFTDGLALVADPATRSWGFLDTSGKLVLSGYKAAGPFSEGLILVDHGARGLTYLNPHLVASARIERARKR